MADHILRNPNLPPEGNGGRLIVPIDMRDITGASIRADHEAVAIKMLSASGDSVVLGMTAAGLDALLETCTKIRATLDGAGVEKSISFSPVSTFKVDLHQVEGLAFVAFTIDRSLPSAAAYLVPPKNARAMADQLKTAARMASSARREITPMDAEEFAESVKGLGPVLGPDAPESVDRHPFVEDACPGHVASADNPKVCGRCGVHIDSLRPPEE